MLSSRKQKLNLHDGFQVDDMDKFQENDVPNYVTKGCNRTKAKHNGH